MRQLNSHETLDNNFSNSKAVKNQTVHFRQFDITIFRAERGEKLESFGKKLFFVGYLQVSRRSVCPHRNVLLAPYRDSPFNIVACNPNLAWRLKNSALNSDVASSPLFPSSFFLAHYSKTPYLVQNIIIFGAFMNQNLEFFLL